MSTETATATIMSATVSMVFRHRSMKPMKSSAREVKTRRLQRPMAKDSKARPTMTAGQGNQRMALSMRTSTTSMTALRLSKSQLASLLSQSTASSIALPVTWRTVRSSVVTPPPEVATSV